VRPATESVEKMYFFKIVVSFREGGAGRSMGKFFRPF